MTLTVTTLLNAQSTSVFDANYFDKDNTAPPIKIGKGFHMNDIYKQTRSCFTSETANPNKLTSMQTGGKKTNIKLFYTKTNEDYNILGNILYNIETSLNPFIYSKEQTDFRNNMIINDQIAENPDDALRLVDNYYNDKYSESRENFTSSRVNKYKSKETFTNSVDPQIEKLFFGSYKPVPGQFLALSDLIFCSFDVI